MRVRMRQVVFGGDLHLPRGCSKEAVGNSAEGSSGEEDQSDGGGFLALVGLGWRLIFVRNSQNLEEKRAVERENLSKVGRMGFVSGLVVGGGQRTQGNAVCARRAAVVCEMKKLFVGGISWGTDDEMLRDAFASFGDVSDAKVIYDRETGRSRGFGFVTFDLEEDADTALQSMDGQELDGRVIRVNEAKERSRESRPPRTPRPFDKNDF